MKTLTSCNKTVFRNFINNNSFKKVVEEDTADFYVELHYNNEGTLVAEYTSQESYDEVESYGWRTRCKILVGVV